jgi:hypothetical protein
MRLKGQDTMQQLEAALRCPLCLRIMEDPVIVISSSGSPQLKPGVSYERSELEAELECPVCLGREISSHWPFKHYFYSHLSIRNYFWSEF